jgi:hypothetical protein
MTAAGTVAVPAAWLQQQLRLQLPSTELQAPTVAAAGCLVLLLLLVLLCPAAALSRPHCCRHQLEWLPQQLLPLLLQTVRPFESCCETQSCCLSAAVQACQQQQQHYG